MSLSCKCGVPNLLNTRQLLQFALPDFPNPIVSSLPKSAWMRWQGISSSLTRGLGFESSHGNAEVLNLLRESFVPTAVLPDSREKSLQLRAVDTRFTQKNCAFSSTY